MADPEIHFCDFSVLSNILLEDCYASVFLAVLWDTTKYFFMI